MSKIYPRRRDVLARLAAMVEALGNGMEENCEFERDFLTDVRDSMRAGASLEEAVLAAAEEDAEPELAPEYGMSEWQDYLDRIADRDTNT